ncbi:MAG: isochorismatase [Candidatus Binatia bacterium]|nr:MAG: isochorismatase [Candidatus Binatia bacterium]
MSDELSLDRGRTAVLVIECQNDLIHESHLGEKGVSGGLARAVAERGVLGRIAEVLSAARAAGIPVLYANKETKPGIPPGRAPIHRLARNRPILLEGSWGAQVHEAIAPQEGDLVLRRFLGIDPSADSELFGTLGLLRRDTVIVMGVSTNFAVEGTVRGAVNLGLSVLVPEDCCASVPWEMHRFSVERILPLLATVTSSSKIVAALARA